MANYKKEVVIGIVVAVFLLVAYPGSMVGKEKVSVEVNTEKVVFETSDKFLSVAIDLAQVLGDKWWDPKADVEWGLVGSRQGRYDSEPFDFNRKRLINMSKALGPGYLKIGGAKADFLCYFGEIKENCDSVLTKERWDEINKFALDSGFEIIFTLNGGLGARNEKKEWDPEFARELVEYSVKKKYPVGAWKLGGEANAFLLQGLKWRISSRQLAKDYSVFKKFVEESRSDAKVLPHASAFWPVIGEPFSIMKPYLKKVDGLDVVSWHYYPTQSSRCPVFVRRAKPEMMLKPERLDSFKYWNRKVSGLRDRYSSSSEVWLTETGHAQCGGQKGVSGSVCCGALVVGSAWPCCSERE
jgi:heparanase 1